MFRVEMMMSRRGSLATVLDWFAHSHKRGEWSVTVNDVGDRIFSLPVDVNAEDITKPAIVVARLWPQLLEEGVTFDFGGQLPTHLQAEVRQYTGPGHWPQSSGWLWQDGTVVVYRSHPVIRTDSKRFDIASPELLAGECFAYAAELEAS
jgi:glyoxylase-like metal-dependent hydrolase (beta-lactamase superfamily II)